MTQKDFNKTAGTLFLVIAAAHLIRIVSGWDVEINGNLLPVWASWLAVIVGGYMAKSAFKKTK